MSTFAVVTFPDEKKAYEGVRAFKQLHDEGSITLYGFAVVQRGADGKIAVKEQQTEPPIGTGVGALVLGLTGLFAGGPAGAAIGLGAGTALGALGDVFNLGVGDEFLESVSRELTPGKTAVVAEVSEEWITPLDARMEASGGTVLREVRDDFIDDEIQKRIDKRKAELAQRRAERAAARAEKVEAMKNEVSKAEQKLRAAADDAGERMKRNREETEAKIQALQNQAKKASADAKSRIDARIAEIRADQKQRLGKLEQARKLAQEALRP